MSVVSSVPLRILYVEQDSEASLNFIKKFGQNLNINPLEETHEALAALKDHYPADAVILSYTPAARTFLKEIRSTPWLQSLPVLVTVPKLSAELAQEAQQAGANDIFPSDFSKGDLLLRLHYFLRKNQLKALQPSETPRFNVKIPWWKRLIDISATGAALILLSPLLLVVILLIRLDSKGPIIYKSKRVGTGYKVFNLLKFRTMRTDADKMVKDMAAFNMYNKEVENTTSTQNHSLCAECKASGYTACPQMLYLDNEHVCEKVYLQRKHNKAAFMKFGNDPRITRIGGFLRNTSIDELPQLINIFRGDMSLVGNRPLPLYEAEKLTSDEYILRFAGPAGLTGLWQVTKRGKGKQDMSEEERMQLDIEYARNFSFAMDMKIIFKTFPALFQSENV
ncbi:sugar transferase [Siphonobacter sp. SORGH_AS_1065]|uniref:sugar transferase n=1 Tax=Siphonobacter sp. SORGH_AS_1065 TaxID=3041795 RepID=UPI00277E6C37|nr:sugar transferase [Siphonobacter sp. SORGH_AS_1065]MDQ1086919.1 lipopolysaccharide/colanic/teichoic acid biosynthesis glycosyltransferase [Siphonobacter sp. SORGH_AS_1065]